MIFTIVNKDTEILRIRDELVKEFRSHYPQNANLISYSMEGIQFPFQKLWQKISNSTRRNEFFNNYYILQSDNAFIKEFIPASEYYKIAFTSITEKFISLKISEENIIKIANEILLLYNEKYSVNPQTKQSFIIFDKEVYSLKREVSVFLYDSRSLLDSMVTMFHFLYGPKSRQYRSFSDFIKECNKDITKTKITDNKMREFIINNSDWYYLLKDVRDYIAHFSSIDISFYEVNKKLKVYLFGRNFIDLEKLTSSVKKGIVELINFVDEHFSNSIS